MELSSYFRAILALLFVIALVWLVSFLLKKLAAKNLLNKAKVNKRISVEEICSLDIKRRLVLVKRDDVEHLILLGINSDLVIETNIKTGEK